MQSPDNILLGSEGDIDKLVSFFWPFRHMKYIYQIYLSLTFCQKLLRNQKLDKYLWLVLQSIGSSEFALPFQFPERMFQMYAFFKYSFSESMIVKQYSTQSQQIQFPC